MDRELQPAPAALDPAFGADPSVDANSNAMPQVPPPAPVVIKRRAPVACKRCRRMRSKCVHKGASPPCDSCREAGLSKEDCIFPKRGQPDNDRDYRHPRTRAEKPPPKRDTKKARRDGLDPPPVRPTPVRPPPAIDPFDYLPPREETIDAVQMFTRHYFQLGFIPKQMFINRLEANQRDVSVFLLLSLLSISARFTPSLVQRYGTGMKAADLFMDRASRVALDELYEEPNLERCQGFYLLAIAQQGSGFKNRSSINLGIAMRMASLMRLHREETYAVPKPTPDMVIQAESARRTIWMLHSQDNLHSGPSSPVSLAASDITTLLPSNEEDFDSGREPQSRAALEGTPPAIEHPGLICDPHRSLFATLIQTHHLWGTIARRAVTQDKSARPWDRNSEFAKLEEKLEAWERNLPHDHQWSTVLLAGYKQRGQDLAYLAVTTVTRLANVVIRKSYLNNILQPDTNDPQILEFWSKMSRDLFMNVKMLFDQIDTQFKERAPDEGTGAQMAAFCVYSCGIMAYYLYKYPNICPDPTITSQDGKHMFERTVGILHESQTVWPLASRWLDGLKKLVTTDHQNTLIAQEGSMADGRDPIPHALHPPLAFSPTLHGPPQTPLDDKRKLARQLSQGQQLLATSPKTLAALMPGPPPIPTPDMFIDPFIRLPPPQPQAPIPPQLSQADVHIDHRHSQSPSIGRPPTNNLDLLVAAFDTQRGVNMPPPPAGAVAYAEQSRHITPEEYYGNPHLTATNDGYENELQFYIDGGQNMPQSVWGGSMYNTGGY